MCIFDWNKENLRGFFIGSCTKNPGPVIRPLMILISASFAGKSGKKMQNYSVNAELFFIVWLLEIPWFVQEAACATFFDRHIPYHKRMPLRGKKPVRTNPARIAVRIFASA